MEQATRDLKKINRKSKHAREDGSTARNALWNNILKNNSFGLKFQATPPLEGVIPDFYCAKLKFAIEVDGTDYDNKKIKKLKSLGIYTLKLSSSDILYFPDLVELEIAKQIEMIEKELRKK